MNKAKRPRRVRVSSAAADGPVMREQLPLPVVHYPRRGAFLGFAEDENAMPVLCACARPAIEHAIRLHEQQAAVRDKGVHLLDPALVPERLVERTLAQRDDPLSALVFRRAVCHRCNLAQPALRHSHELEAGRFVQYYGWYVAQAYYRYGIDPETHAYLSDVCPDELLPYAETIAAAASALEDPSWEASMGASPGSGAPGLHASSLPIASRRYTARQYRRACTSLDKAIENTVRQEFGFRPVGEGWISETMLYQIVARLYPGVVVVRCQHPAWLDGLELDVHLPELDLAFEYQGQQHFYPVKAWGGEEALQQVQARDEHKAALCAERGVALVAIDYTEPLSEAYVAKRVREANLAKVAHQDAQKPSQGEDEKEQPCEGCSCLRKVM